MLQATEKLWQDLGVEAFVEIPHALRHEAWAERYLSGETTAEIAADMRMSVHTVYRALKALNTPMRLQGPRGPRKASQERIQTMIAMYESGLTLEEVGQKYDLTRERIRQILVASGYAPRTVAYVNISRRKKNDEAILDLIKQNYRPLEISEELSISYARVLRVYQRHGLNLPSRTAPRTLQALKMFDEGASVQEIATALGYQHLASLQTLLHKHGRTLRQRQQSQAQKAAGS